MKIRKLLFKSFLSRCDGVADCPLSETSEVFFSLKFLITFFFIYHIDIIIHIHLQRWTIDLHWLITNTRIRQCGRCHVICKATYLKKMFHILFCNKNQIAGRRRRGRQRLLGWWGRWQRVATLKMGTISKTGVNHENKVIQIFENEEILPPPILLLS